MKKETNLEKAIRLSKQPDIILSFASKTSIEFAEWIGNKYIWMYDNIWMPNTLEKFDFNSDKKYDEDSITTSDLFKMYLKHKKIDYNKKTATCSAIIGNDCMYEVRKCSYPNDCDKKVLL